MQAIADNAGPGTRAGAICFSLPHLAGGRLARARRINEPPDAERPGF